VEGETMVEWTGMGDPPPPSRPGRWARTCASRAAAGPERKWWRKYETLGFPGQCLRFYSYEGYMQAGMDLGPGHKFKLGRNNLAGSIFFRACPKWTKPTEFRAFRAESQIPRAPHPYPRAPERSRGEAGSGCSYLSAPASTPSLVPRSPRRRG
jgi:hypothetical protein